jgi:hypothetical protein
MDYPETLSTELHGPVIYWATGSCIAFIVRERMTGEQISSI